MSPNTCQTEKGNSEKAILALTVAIRLVVEEATHSLIPRTISTRLSEESGAAKTKKGSTRETIELFIGETQKATLKSATNKLSNTAHKKKQRIRK